MGLSKFLAQSAHLNWALLDQALVSGANFLSGIFLVRLLGIQDYGVFVLLWMIVQFSMSLQNALIVAPMMSITPKIDPSDREVYLSSTLVLQIVVILFVTGAALLTLLLPHCWMPDWWANDLLTPLIACMVLFQMQDYLRRSFFVRRLPPQAFYIDLLAYGGQLLLLLTLLNTFPSVSNALWIIAFCFALSIGLGSLLIERQPGVSMAVLRSTTVRHWVSSRWLLGAAVLQWFSGNYFLITAGALLGPSAVGAIRAAQNLMGITHIAFQGLENIVPTRAIRALHELGTNGLRRYVYRVLAGLLVFTGLVAVVMTVFAEPIFNKMRNPPALPG